MVVEIIGVRQIKVEGKIIVEFTDGKTAVYDSNVLFHLIRKIN